MNLTTSGVARGCGNRKQGGLYLCVGMGGGGRPIEDFVVDPPRPWTDGHFQGVGIHQRKDGIYDVLLWVGEEFYPFVPDFVEEARRLGISKKVSASVDFSMLTPYQSRLILVHPKVISDGVYKLQDVASVHVPHINRPEKDDTRHPCDHEPTRKKKQKQCTFSLWDTSAHDSCKNHETDLGTTNSTITTPSCTYKVMRPVAFSAEPNYSPGIFLAIPFTHFEYVNKKGGVPEKVNKKLGSNTDYTYVVDK